MTKLCSNCEVEKPLTDFYKFFEKWAGKAATLYLKENGEGYTS
jgi:hypothetical protein